MHCEKCGNKIEGDAKLCQKCSNEQGGTSKSVVVSVLLILVFIIAFFGVRYLTQEGINSVSQDNSPSKQEMIDSAVAEIKGSVTFPIQVDQFTIWTSITGTPNAIHYQYTLQNIDKSKLSDTILKNIIAPTLCTNTNTRYILDKDINMEYSYDLQGSTQKYFFVVSKKDCI